MDEGDSVYLEIYVDENMMLLPSKIISTDMLEVPRIVGQPFTNPDGANIIFDIDLKGDFRKGSPVAGPLENLVVGYNKILIWTRK